MTEFAPGRTASTFAVDRLIAGDYPIVTRTEVLVSGQNLNFVASAGGGSFGSPPTGITQGGALAANGPGGGGSGGANNNIGAAGAPGAIIVEFRP